MNRLLPSLFAISMAVAAYAKPAADPVDLVIRNVTVIDPASRKVLPRRDVMVDEGRIVAIAASGKRVPSADRIVDGTGKFAIPGLMDMHVHTGLRPIHQASLLLNIANGVTGVRDMASDCNRPGGIALCIDEMRKSAAAIEAGTLPGPRLLALSTMKVQSLGGPADTSDPRAAFFPRSAAEGGVTASLLLARKPDIIKIGDSLDPGAYGVLVKAAKQAGIEASGHVPLGLSVAEVARLGQRSIEHARDLPLDCSTYGAAFRAEMKAAMPKAAPSLEAGVERTRKVLASQDKAICKAQIAAMVSNGTYYVPTHLTRAMDFRAGDTAYRADPRMTFVHPQLAQMWTRDLDRYAKLSAQDADALKSFYLLGLRLTGESHRAGVKIMAGTDSNDTMVFPGFSLHDELLNLVAAGLSPMDALRAATTVPAQYLHRSRDFGSLSQGKLADIVLLRADPLASIANTTSIEMVMQGGRVYDRAALDGMLADARKLAAGGSGR